MEQFVSKSQKDTEKIGKKIAKKFLTDGGVVLLEGPLGAGKTALVRGIAQGLGIKRLISSPTFVFLKIYGRLYHLDLYRLNKPEEFEILGVQELIENNDNKIFVIEWPSRTTYNFQNAISINIEKSSNADNERIITLL